VDIYCEISFFEYFLFFKGLMGRVMYTTRSFLQLLHNNNLTKIIYQQKMSTSEVSSKQSVSNREREKARPRASNETVPNVYDFKKRWRCIERGLFQQRVVLQ